MKNSGSGHLGLTHLCLSLQSSPSYLRCKGKK